MANGQAPIAKENTRRSLCVLEIVAVLKDSVLRSSAFYFYQDTPKRAVYCDHMKTIDFIEEKTGLDFFPNYGGQDKLESSSALLKEELGC